MCFPLMFDGGVMYISVFHFIDYGCGKVYDVNDVWVKLKTTVADPK